MITIPKSLMRSFTVAINYELSGNLSSLTTSGVASLLAIDYVTRLNSAPPILEYAKRCAFNIKSFLKYKVITEESFSTNLFLFSVAITPIGKNIKDLENRVNNLEEDPAIIPNFIEMQMSSFSLEEKKKIKKIFENLISGKENGIKLDFIAANIKLIRIIIKEGLNNYQNQRDLNNFIVKELSKLLNKSIELKKNAFNLKDQITKVSAALSLMGIASMSFFAPAAALPLMMVPATFAMIKYSPLIANQIGEVIIKKSPYLKKSKTIIASMKLDLEKKYSITKKNSQPLQNLKLEGVKLLPELGLKITTKQDKYLEAQKPILFTDKNRPLEKKNYLNANSSNSKGKGR